MNTNNPTPPDFHKMQAIIAESMGGSQRKPIQMKKIAQRARKMLDKHRELAMKREKLHHDDFFNMTPYEAAMYAKEELEVAKNLRKVANCRKRDRKRFRKGLHDKTQDYEILLSEFMAESCDVTIDYEHDKNDEEGVTAYCYAFLEFYERVRAKVSEGVSRGCEFIHDSTIAQITREKCPRLWSLIAMIQKLITDCRDLLVQYKGIILSVLDNLVYIFGITATRFNSFARALFDYVFVRRFTENVEVIAVFIGTNLGIQKILDFLHCKILAFSLGVPSSVLTEDILRLQFSNPKQYEIALFYVWWSNHTCQEGCQCFNFRKTIRRERSGPNKGSVVEKTYFVAENDKYDEKMWASSEDLVAEDEKDAMPEVDFDQPLVKSIISSFFPNLDTFDWTFSLFEGLRDNEMYISIRNLVVSMVSLKMFGKGFSKNFRLIFGAGDKNTSRSLVDLIGDVGALMRRLMTCASAIKEGVPLEKACGFVNTKDTFARADLLIKQCSIKVYQDNIEESVSTSELIIECNELIDELKVLKATCNKGGKTRAKCDNYITELGGLIYKYKSAMASASRMQPFGLVLVGDPGVGKSTWVLYWMAVYCSLIGMKFSNDLLYVRSNSNFWDGFTSFLHRFVLYKELGSMSRELAARVVDERTNELLEVIDGHRYMCEQAEANLKGTEYLNAFMIMADVNNWKLNADVTQFAPAAIWRRFTFIHIEVLEQYQKDDGSCELDPMKFPEVDFLDKYRVTISQKVALSNTQYKDDIKCTTTDIRVATSCMVELMTLHINKQRRLREKLADPKSLLPRLPDGVTIQDIQARLYSGKDVVYDVKEEALHMMDYQGDLGDPPFTWADYWQWWRNYFNDKFTAVFYYIIGYLLFLVQGQTTICMYLAERLQIYIRKVLLVLFIFITSFHVLVWFFGVWPWHVVLYFITIISASFWTLEYLNCCFITEPYVGHWIGLGSSYYLQQAASYWKPTKETLYRIGQGALSAAVLLLIGQVVKYAIRAKDRQEINKEIIATLVPECDTDVIYNDIIPDVTRIYEKSGVSGPPRKISPKHSANLKYWNAINNEVDYTYTQGFKSLGERLSRQTKVVLARNLGGKHSSIHIMPYTGQAYLINKHYINFLEKNDDGSFNLAISTTGDIHNDLVTKVALVDSMVSVPGTSDLCMIHVNVDHAKDFSKHFLQRASVECDKFLGFYQGQEVIVRKVPEGAVFNINDGQTLVAHNLFMCEYDGHANGDCGLGVTVDLDKRSAILGFHSWGSKVSNKVFFQALIAEDLEEAYKQLNTQRGFDFIVMPQSDVQVELVPIGSHSLSSWIPTDGMDCLGDIKGMPCLVNQKSDIVRGSFHDIYSHLSPLVDEEIKDDSAPALLHPTNKDGVYIDPMHKFVAGVQLNGTFDISTKAQRYIIDNVLRNIENKLRAKEIFDDSWTPISIHDVLNSCPDNIYFRGANLKTSAGFGLRGKKKDYCYKNSKDLWCLNPEVQSEVAMIIAAYERGETYGPIIGSAFKDEVRSRKKVRNGDTRLFFPGPFAFYVVQSMYLGPFFKLMLECPEAFNCALGIDAHKEFDDLLSDLLRVPRGSFKDNSFYNERLRDFDFKKFDVNQIPAIKMCVDEIIYQTCKGKGFNEFSLTCVTGILSDCYTVRFLLRNTLYSMTGFQPSGTLGTAESNSLYNLCTQLAAWYDHPDCRDNDFFDNVESRDYGDDLLMKVFNGFEDRYSIAYLESWYRLHGMTLTPGDKTESFNEGQTVLDTAFLQRSFYFNQTLGRVVGCLKPSRIGKSLFWRMKSECVSKYEQELSTCMSALREVFLYDNREVFDNVRQYMLAVLDSDAAVDRLPTWFSLTDSLTIAA